MNSQQKIQGKNPFSSANIGKIFGFLAGVSWALVAIFLLLHDQSFRLRVDGLSTILDSLRISVSISFVSESMAFIWAFFVVISFKKVNLIKKAFTNKNVLWLIFGSIFGGPFGSVTYILGIHYIGPGLVSSITVAYPVIAAMLAYLFLKQKMSINSMIGGAISLLAILTLGILQFSSGDLKSGWGFLFALFAAIGWAIESFMGSKAMDSNIDPIVSIFIRQCVSFLFIGIVLVPSFNAFKQIKLVATNIDVLWILGSSFIGIVSFVLFYISINKAGVGVASGLNICYVVWIILFELMIPKFYPWYIYILVVTVFLAQLITLLPDINKNKLKRKKE